MSLNGLDDPEVAQAYEAAVAEAGGWFLLKYSSRDEVALLSNGTGGVSEVRSAVAAYEESSPLYGFLKYRRRNVLIKYLPEGCSRLIQARMAVHFNAVCERFSPYDSQFDMTVADDLVDSKLSPACSLHAAKASSSSSGSRKKHLMEIAEEEEEEQQPTKRQSLIKETEESKRPTTTGEPVTLNSDLAASPEHSKFSAPTTSEVPTFVGSDDGPLPTENSRRLSSQSSRAEVFTSYSAYSYSSKPKVKLGPRPSMDANLTRPQTAGNFRPVSSIPAGLKLFGKGGTANAKRRKDSVGSNNAPTSPKSEITDFAFHSASIPIPEEPTNKGTLDVPRPATSSGVSTKSNMSSKIGMTPEKARLKKALQLREKKKQKAAQANSVPVTPVTETASDDTASTIKPEHEGAEVQSPTTKPDDSGVAMDSSPVSSKDDRASEGTQSDSRATSPVVASEAEHSTKASSLSESTDQTVTGEHREETVESAADSAVDASPENKNEIDQAVSTHEQAEQKETTEESQPSPAVESLVGDVHAEESADTSSSPSGAVDSSMQQDETSSKEEGPDGRGDETTNREEKKDGGVEEPINANADNLVSTAASPSEATEEHKIENDEIKEAKPENIDTPEPQAEKLESPNPLSPRIQVPDAKSTETPVEEPIEDDAQTPVATTQEDSTSPKPVDESVIGDQSPEDSKSTSPSHARKPSASKRKANVEPIRIDLANRDRSASQSDLNLSDDESLLEELQSATFHEAKPMTVSKTPLTPVFPLAKVISNGNMSAAVASPPGSAASLPGTVMAKPQMVRTASNPVRGGFIAPPSDVSQSSARSVSQGAAYLHQVTQQRTADGNLSKKTNMGSSISQRIKALEMLSVSSAEQPASQPGSRPSSSFFQVKPRVPSRSPSVVDRTNSFTRPSTAQSRDDSPDPSRFHRERSGSISSRLSMFEPGGSPGNTPRGRPETVSVTARIIRDSPSVSRTRPESSHLDLKQSPLVVDHQRPDVFSSSPETAGESLLERRASHSRNRSRDSETRRSSFNVVKEFIKEHRKSMVSSPSSDNLTQGPRSPGRPPSTHQNNTFASRLSISSRRSIEGRDTASTATEGSVSGDESRSGTGDKRMSRAGRLMRRLSTFSGGKGQKANLTAPGGTPTVTEEGSVALSAKKRNTPSVVADLGDVNVQFPDTLLWKRRNMYLDSDGYVVLSALAQQQQLPGKTTATTGIKKYHLSEFKTPYTPDVEVQELPNSVVLDLVEGSAVQVACEDRTGQMHVLAVLQHSHAAHTGN